MEGWHSILTSMGNLHRILAGIVLVAGLTGASVIYLTTSENDTDGATGFTSVLDPSNSKMFRHDMRVYGGMANIYADEFIRWFAGLWHGKSLAFTVGAITLFVSFVLFYFADLLYWDEKTGIPGDKHGAKPE